MTDTFLDQANTDAPELLHAYAMLHLRAQHDLNGNPRRLFVLISRKGDVTYVSGVWDEGYSGRNAVPAPYRDMARNACLVNVSATEYRRYKMLERI